MKYLLDFKTFESTSIEESEEVLHVFQKANNIQVDIETLIKSISAFKLDFNSIFKGTDVTNINSLETDKKFQLLLKKNKYKKSELFDTKDNTTLVNKPFKYCWIYDDEVNEFAIPIYMIIQRIGFKIDLYYVQDTLNKFYSKMDTITLEIKQSKQSYIYKSSNSGRDWTLQDKSKQSVVFTPHLNMEDIDIMKKNSLMELSFY